MRYNINRMRGLFASPHAMKAENLEAAGGAAARETAGKPRHSQHEHRAADRPDVPKWLAAILAPVHAVFMRWYFRIEVSGADKIPSTGPFILAPLHRSRWDPFMVYLAVTRRVLYFMTSHDEVVGVQGWFMRRLGAFPINVQNPSPSVIRTCKELISRGEALVIFPEGNLFYYGRGEVHPLKPGIARLALSFLKGLDQGDLPIVPIRLDYSHRKLRARSRAKILVGEPISTGDYAHLPPKAGASALTSALQEALGNVINETSSAESLQSVISAHDRTRGIRKAPHLSDVVGRHRDVAALESQKD